MSTNHFNITIFLLKNLMNAKSKQLFHTKSFVKLAIQNIESLHNNRIINFFDSLRRENLQSFEFISHSKCLNSTIIKFLPASRERKIQKEAEFFDKIGTEREILWKIQRDARCHLLCRDLKRFNDL